MPQQTLQHQHLHQVLLQRMHEELHKPVQQWRLTCNSGKLPGGGSAKCRERVHSMETETWSLLVLQMLLELLLLSSELKSHLLLLLLSQRI